MKQITAKVYELEANKKKAEQQITEESKLDIAWGNQIRSYILDDLRVKDMRTHVETRNVQSVLNGEIDIFLKKMLQEEMRKIEG